MFKFILQFFFMYLLLSTILIYVILWASCEVAFYWGKRSLSLSRQFHYIDYIFKKIKQFLKRFLFFCFGPRKSTAEQSDAIQSPRKPSKIHTFPFFHFPFFSQKIGSSCRFLFFILLNSSLSLFLPKLCLTFTTILEVSLTLAARCGRRIWRYAIR